MSETVAKLLEQLLELPSEDRRLIAEQLQGSLDAEQLPDDPEWRAEFDRRLQSVADGTAELIPWEQARDEIRAELARRWAARTPSEPA
jgi:putative addiction module component (TIGR02574 family)